MYELKPVICVTCFNRVNNTKECLTALLDTVEPSEAIIIVVNNNSTDGTHDYLISLPKRENFHILHSDTNLGSISALNYVIQMYRCQGQPFIKIDNDVVILSKDWLKAVNSILEKYSNIAAISGYYNRLKTRAITRIACIDGFRLYEINNPLGHCNYYTGEFIDIVGYFECLREDHLIGYEDNLMFKKCLCMGFKHLTWEGWQIKSIPTETALIDARITIESIRPLYKKRCRDIMNNRTYRVNSQGMPI